MSEHDTVEVYEDKLGEWRWRSVARNGETIATSGEGYRDRTHAEKMARRVTGHEAVEA